MNRYLCLHLHFYQPPRENPWLGEIEYQESAYPFHDWNERINVECYRANGASRILDAQGRVVDLANNYAKTSWNFGPTLLSWLEDKDPMTYERLLEADRMSQKQFGGHGSAIAQAYNHVIMPLANWRDKETQIIWGLKDFETRFRREAEAMWLPETAVDTESLEMLAAHGMKYVILAPRQAKAVRSLERDEDWQNVSDEKVDPREPYLIRLPSGRTIVGFFYDGGISKAVAFEGLLHNGETFANRLMGGFRGHEKSPANQLLHIATDGETYGHHHRLGDMALAYALWHVEKNKLATLTNYGQYLELNPPKKEAQIHENSSWSCAHGIERWKSDCGCNSGGKDWHQRWREPLRAALDLVRDRVEKPYEETLLPFMADPWGARNAYIDLIENRSLANIEAFLAKWCRTADRTNAETTTILKALEAQRHLLLMYTSCAWFFDEISGIETIQNLQYAYRAIELGESVFGVAILEDFLVALAKAESNLPGIGNGRVAFDQYVKPALVDNLRVGIHFAVSSVFESFGPKNEVYNNKITLLDFKRFESGKASLACGQARIRSRITLERQNITFGVIHLGDHNVSAGIKVAESSEQYRELMTDAKRAFDRADFPETIRVFDRYFGTSTYSLKDLFKDEQKRVVDVIMSETMMETEERFNRLYRTNYPIACYLSDLHFPLPKVVEHVAEFVQNRGVRRTLRSKGRVRTDEVRAYLEEAHRWNVPLDTHGLAHELEEVIEEKMLEFEDADQSKGQSIERLEELLDLVTLGEEPPFKMVNLGPVQNWFFLWFKNRVSMRGSFALPPTATPAEIRYEETAKLLGEQLHVILPEQSALIGPSQNDSRRTDDRRAEYDPSQNQNEDPSESGAEDSHDVGADHEGGGENIDRKSASFHLPSSTP
jgi:alpha-amylase/alpha-mannosidase (GH57 family)